MSSTAEKIDLLRTVDLFRDLNKSQLTKIARVVDEVSVPDGRAIIQERKYRESGGASFYLILEGKAEVTVRGKRVGHLNDGDSFGEMSLLDGKPRTATVTSMSPMALYRIRSWHFKKLVLQEPAIAVALMKTLAGRLRIAEENQTRRR